MSITRVRNHLRMRAIAVSRSMKAVFRPGGTARDPIVRAIRFVLNWLWLWPLLTAWSYRLTFTANGRELRRAAEHVIADLRNFCCAKGDGKKLFDADPLEMARRVGRREVFERIINYLNLDEGQVQLLMEIDDGD